MEDGTEEHCCTTKTLPKPMSFFPHMYPRTHMLIWKVVVKRVVGVYVRARVHTHVWRPEYVY